MNLVFIALAVPLSLNVFAVASQIEMAAAQYRKQPLILNHGAWERNIVRRVAVRRETVAEGCGAPHVVVSQSRQCEIESWG